MDSSRRMFVRNNLLAAIAVTGHRSMAATDQKEVLFPTMENLSATQQIETTHPRIALLSQQITKGTAGDVDAAIQVHNWVRDEISFGIPGGFYNATACDVLDEKVGYCNTKATLFNALLRAKGIPTRIRMMDLSAQVLNGLFDPGTTYVDHSITEVFLDQRWIKVDSYVVDSQLAAAAAKRLRGGNVKAAFGIHVDGQVTWNGRQDNFIQCKDNGSIPNYVLKDHGLFADIADFYKRSPDSRNKTSVGSALLLRFGASFINRQIQSIRTS